MSKKNESWYIHGALYVVIAILIYILVRVAIIDPTEHIAKENYFRSESQSRMNNIRQAQILWEREHEQYSDDLAQLVEYIKSDSTVNALMVGIDTLTNRSTNPFKNLTNGVFDADSLIFSPKSQNHYLMEIDTTTTIDTVINQRGKFIRVDTTTVIGSFYFLRCPDGYGVIGDTLLESKSLTNTATWE